MCCLGFVVWSLLFLQSIAPVSGAVVPFTNPLGSYNTVYDSGSSFGSYSNNEDNLYTFTCNPGKVVTFYFLQFSLGDSIDKFVIHDGPDTASPTACSPCSFLASKYFTMSSNTASFHFTSNGAITGAGWQARYFCNDPYTALSGTIYDDGGPTANYGSSLWYFQPVICPIGSKVVYSFSQIELDVYSNCNYGDTLYVNDVDLVTRQHSTGMSACLGTYTSANGLGSKHGESMSNIIAVYFYSDSIDTKPGYTMSYYCKPSSSPALSGTLYDSGGAFGKYGDNESREQTVECPSSMYVHLRFAQLQMETSPDCGKDVIRLFDGTSDNDSLLFRGCTFPGSSAIFMTSSNRAYVKFESDESGKAMGYTLQWTCFSKFEDSNGVIYDNGGATMPYFGGANTLQVIQCPVGKFVSATLTQMAIDGTPPACATDALRVYDALVSPMGHSRSLLYTGCGSLPTGLWSGPSRGNIVLVSFISDAHLQRAGYALRYECTSIPMSYALSGVIFDSGGMNGKYSNNESNTAGITCPVGMQLYLWFTLLDIQYSANCAADSLRLYDVSSSGQRALITPAPPSCGVLSPDMLWQGYSSSNQLQLDFKSDGSVVSKGYALHWQCILKVTAASGDLYDSGGSTGSYGNNEIRNQVIMCDEGKVVKANFVTFDIESTTAPTPCKDYIQIFDGRDVASSLIFYGCGSTFSTWSAFSSSRFLLLRFTSNDGVTKAGYKLHYECKDVGYTQVTASPVYDTGSSSGPYKDNDNQKQMIICGTNEKVSITGLDWNIDTSDVLTIYDGATAESAVLFISIVSVSGTGWSAFSSTNKVYFTFQADPAITNTGYKLDWLCTANYGVVYNATETMITSGELTDKGGLGGKYTNYENMKTLLVCPEGMFIRSYFSQFDLQPGDAPNSCNNDVFAVYDGPDTKSPLLLRDCGLRKGDELWKGYSTHNSLFLTFSSDQYLVKGGYALSWECSSSTSAETTYFIAADGSDSNECGLEDPCETFGRAIDKAKSNFELNLVFSITSFEGVFDSRLCDNEVSFFQSITISGKDNTIDCGGKSFVVSRSKDSVFRLHDITFTTLKDIPVVPLLEIRNAGRVELKNVRQNVGKNLRLVFEDVQSILLEGCTFNNATVVNSDEADTVSALVYVSRTSNQPQSLIISKTEFQGCNGYYDGLLLVRNNEPSNEAELSFLLENSTFGFNVGANSPVTLREWGVGAVVVRDSQFTSNSLSSSRSIDSGRSGGAISAESTAISKLIIALDHTSFENNESKTGSGGAISIIMARSLVIRNCNIKRNTASAHGGGVYGKTMGSSIVILDSSIVENEAYGDGCGVYSYSILSDTVNPLTESQSYLAIETELMTESQGLAMIRTVVKGNKNTFFSNALGGGIYANEIATLKLEDVTLTLNSNGVGGGAFILNVQTFTASHLTCSQNQAALNAGCMAISLSSVVTAGVVTCTDSVFDSNSANTLGGGLSLKGPITATISRSIIEGNKASLNGGFAELAGGSSLVLLDTEMMTSMALTGGAVQINADSSLHIRGGCSIHDNIALNGSVATLTDKSAYVHVSGDNIRIFNQKGKRGAVFYGVGFVAIGANVVIEKNRAGPVTAMGDSESAYVGFGSLLYFSGSSPPLVPSNLAIANLKGCDLFSIHDSAQIRANSAKVSGALVFIEKLPVVGCSKIGLTLKMGLLDLHSTKDNKAGYGAMVSSFAHTLIAEADKGGAFSPIPSSAVGGFEIYPGLDKRLRLTALDYFDKPLRGNFENLYVQVAHSDSRSSSYGYIAKGDEGEKYLEDGFTILLLNVALVTQGQGGTQEPRGLLELLTKGAVHNFRFKILAPFIFTQCESSMDHTLQVVATESTLRNSSGIDIEVCRERPIMLGLTLGPKVTFAVLLAVCFIVSVFCMVHILLHRRDMNIKMRSPLIWSLRMFGSFCTALGVLLLALVDYETVGCVLPSLMMELGIWTIFFTNIWSFWRLKKLFSNKSMTAVAITEKRILVYIVLSVLGLFVLITPFSSLAGFTLTRPVRNDVLQYTSGVCACTSPWMRFVTSDILIVLLNLPVLVAYSFLYRKIKVLTIPPSFIDSRGSKFTLVAGWCVIFGMLPFVYVPELWTNFITARSTAIGAFILVLVVYNALELTGLLQLKNITTLKKKIEPEATMTRARSLLKVDKEGTTTGGGTGTESSPKDTEGGARGSLKVSSSFKALNSGGGPESESGRTSTKTIAKSSSGKDKHRNSSKLDSFVEDENLKTVDESEASVHAKFKLNDQSDSWYIGLIMEHSKQLKLLSFKSKTQTKIMLDSLVALYKIEKLIDLHAYRGTWLSTEFEFLHEGQPGKIEQLWKDKSPLFSQNGKTVSPAIGIKDFGGIDDRRRVDGSDLFVLNHQLLAYLATVTPPDSKVAPSHNAPNSTSKPHSNSVNSS